MADLVRDLGVSDMTIRRDLELLHRRRLLEKVHGGATALPGNALSRAGFAVRSLPQHPEDDAIAEAAAGLVEPGTAIALSAGTGSYGLAHRLGDVPGITIVTNSVSIADVLRRDGRDDRTIILTGGVRTPTDALVGPLAVAALRTVHVDVVFISAQGMDPRVGFTVPDMLEAETDRALVEAGRRLVVLAGHATWGVIGISSFARLDQADVLISDTGVPAAAQAELRGQVRELVLVEADAAVREIVA